VRQQVRERSVRSEAERERDRFAHRKHFGCKFWQAEPEERSLVPCLTFAMEAHLRKWGALTRIPWNS
jgi:hypothetical protein